MPGLVEDQVDIGTYQGIWESILGGSDGLDSKSYIYLTGEEATGGGLYPFHTFLSYDCGLRVERAVLQIDKISKRVTSIIILTSDKGVYALRRGEPLIHAGRLIGITQVSLHFIQNRILSASDVNFNIPMLFLNLDSELKLILASCFQEP